MADEAPTTGMDRRRFLQVAGVSTAGTAALAGCGTDTGNKLVTYIEQDEDQVPDLPTMYASTCAECAAGCGLHVTTREGRAINVAGNPDHPINAGKLCARGTAGLQGLYNPDRLRGPVRRMASGRFEPFGWDEALTLDAAGETRIEAQPEPCRGPAVWTVGLDEQPIDSSSVFWFHKTTHRRSYEAALERRPDCEEVLLWNIWDDGGAVVGQAATYTRFALLPETAR